MSKISSMGHKVLAHTTTMPQTKGSKQLQKLTAKVRQAAHIKPAAHKFDRQHRLPAASGRTAQKTENIALFQLLQRKATKPSKKK